MSKAVPGDESPRVWYTFGDFALDPATATLSRSGRNRRLRPQSFEVLRYLVEHNGALVSKKDLIASVWHGAPVSDDSVTQCLIDIRKALADDSKTIIRTVPRRGFVFELPVAREVHDRDYAEKRYRDRMSRNGWAAAALLLVVLISAITIAVTSRNAVEPGEKRNPGTRAEESITSIAVLPFTDMSDEGDRQYAADSFADSIIGRLAQSPDIRVIAWSSSFLASQLSSDSVGLGDRLNVDYLLKGSISQSTERVYVSAELLETQNGMPFWSETFDQGLTPKYLIDLHTEVADAVAGAIGARLPADESSPLSGYRPGSTAALDHFQQGMFYLRQIETGVARNYDAAVGHFEEALRIEPDWPAAQAALGRVLHFRASATQVPDDAPLFRRSKEHLLRAIELDSDYGPAFESLAFVLHSWELDFGGAAAAYQRALELGVTQYWGLAILHMSMGDFDAAIARYRMALERDPLSLGLKIQLATALYCGARYSESIEHHERLLEAMPDSQTILSRLAFLYLKNGETEKGVTILDNHPDVLARPGGNALYYALMGLDEKAEEEIAIAEADPAWRPNDVVAAALLLGQKERALAYLEAVAAEEPRSLKFILCDDEVRSLAGEPRYERVLDVIGIP